MPLLFSTAKQEAEVLAQHPIRPGFERLGCYGTIMNAESSETLYSTAKPKTLQKMLKYSWNVTDTASAVETLVRLRDQGHRAEYNPLVPGALWHLSNSLGMNFMGRKSANAPDYVKLFYANVSDSYSTIQAIHETHAEIRKRCDEPTLQAFAHLDNVDAWDFERIGMVVRMSLQAGYLSEDDAYAWLNVADTMTRQRYASWAQYCAAWILGRTLWSGKPQDTAVWRVADAIKGKKANQVWLRYPLG